MARVRSSEIALGVPAFSEPDVEVEVEADPEPSTAKARAGAPKKETP